MDSNEEMQDRTFITSYGFLNVCICAAKKIMVKIIILTQNYFYEIMSVCVSK